IRDGHVTGVQTCALPISVDILPVTVPPGYLADAVVALHADSDGVGQWSGFKMAHSARRGPFEDALLADVKKAYGDATGLEYDPRSEERRVGKEGRGERGG